MTQSLPPLDGLTCEEVAYDGAEWTFRFGADLVLRVASTWRIVSDGQIAVARDDHGQQFGLPSPLDAVAKANALMRGRPIEKMTVSASADLTIDFGGGRRFELFNHSAGYEAWTLHGPGDHLVVGMGGGRVADVGKP